MYISFFSYTIFVLIFNNTSAILVKQPTIHMYSYLCYHLNNHRQYCQFCHICRAIYHLSILFKLASHAYKTHLRDNI